MALGREELQWHNNVIILFYFDIILTGYSYLLWYLHNTPQALQQVVFFAQLTQLIIVSTDF